MALNAQQQKQLLGLAREAIVEHVSQGTITKHDITEDSLNVKSGCFVCIKNGGSLRGCIGNFISDRPLYRLVQEMAVAAATRDPRFYPMRPDDLKDFKLEISVLSPLQKISDPSEVQVGKHGLYIEKNSISGVLLPQVPVQYKWDRETFLAQTCMKAGLKPDDWREGATIQVFTAQVFSER